MYYGLFEHFAIQLTLQTALSIIPALSALVVSTYTCPLILVLEENDPGGYQLLSNFSKIQLTSCCCFHIRGALEFVG